MENRHKCHAYLCNRYIAPEFLMCKKHWRMARPETRKRVLEQDTDAIQEAIDEVVTAECAFLLRRKLSETLKNRFFASSLDRMEVAHGRST